jgi:segregation and condensation protein A
MRERTPCGVDAQRAGAVSVTVSEISLLDSYQLRLPAFEGPLDVLLRLIERSQLAITDISLVAVTDQFLEHISVLGASPAQVIAEFMAVGSRLVLLKSRSLLPRPAASDSEESQDDLVGQLIAYRAVKEAATQLAERDARGEGAFALSPGAVIAPDQPAFQKLAMHESSLLARALRRRLSITPYAVQMVVSRRVVSLREMVERVLTRLVTHDTIRFSEVQKSCADRNEVLTAFLAVLVLVRRRAVEAGQNELFGEIRISRKADLQPISTGSIVSFSADD